jgi:hypothetical protein
MAAIAVWATHGLAHLVIMMDSIDRIKDYRAIT